jgi:hypothetical protein
MRGGKTGMADREKLIERIVESELRMFLSVPSYGEYSCQKYPDNFRLHREAQFSIWSDDTLESYLHDLQRAEKEGMNLMTIKYARMDDLIPRENSNPLIDRIADTQYRWQKEMFHTYPNFMAGARPLSEADDSSLKTSFETYLKGELETYSDNTLSLLYRDLRNIAEKGLNGSKLVYDYLVKELGYGSLEETEQAQEKNNSGNIV